MSTDLIMSAVHNGSREQLEFIYLTESSNHDNFTFDVTSNHMTPLCLAASLDNVDIVNLLLSYGACVNFKIETNGKIPLHFACDKELECSDNTTIVRDLLSAGADINMQDNDGQAPIHFACSNENMQIIETLLYYNVDLDVTDIDNETPLIHACYAENLDLIKLLVHNGCRIDYPNSEPLSMCVSRGLIPAVAFLLDHGEDIHKNGYLSDACGFNHADMMDFLYTFGVDINRRKTSTNFGFTPLHVSCLSQYVECSIVEKLLSWDADVKMASTTGDTALHYAAQQLDAHKVKALLQYGAPVNVEDDIGMTPLTAALSSIFNPELMLCIIQLFSATGCHICQKLEEVVKSHYVTINKIDELNKSVIPLLQKLAKNPLNLKDLCRIRIRNSVGLKIEKNISNLELPKLLIDYLNLHDIYIPKF